MFNMCKITCFVVSKAIFSEIISFSLIKHCGETLQLPIFQIRKVKLKDIKKILHSHTNVNENVS